MTSSQIIESIDGGALLLPDLIKRGLAANDRLKYYLTLLQAASAHAQRPFDPAVDLREARTSSGVTDAGLDEVVAASRRVNAGEVFIPGAARLRELLIDDVRQMLEPIRTIASLDTHAAARCERYNRRLQALTAALPPFAGDRIAVVAVESIAAVSDETHDSLHRLIMDLHRELNRLLANVAQESIDGARASGLIAADRPLVRAFMKGLNQTAPLKFDHPGLGTTASRYGDRLAIQNDLGTTESHLLVVRVDGLAATIIYSDVHRRRAVFFKNLLERFVLEWQATAAVPDSEQQLLVGTYTAPAVPALEEFLTVLGSRLVFLIDWNRARKQLARFTKRSDAIAVLRWAADNGIGHRGFLQAGGLQLIYTAFERMAPGRIRYGARLDELMGREATLDFLKAVLRIAASGMKARRSERLIQDEIEAELLPHLQTAERQMLELASEHAMLLSATAERMRRTLGRASTALARDEIADIAALATQWERRADAIVADSTRLLDHGGDGRRLLIHLFGQADDAIDALEEIAFLLTLLPEVDPNRLALLRGLADLVGEATKDYVRSLEYAKELSDTTVHSVMKDALASADRMTDVEHASDAAERAVKSTLIGVCTDCRELQVLFDVVRSFERAANALARCGWTIRDYALASGAARIGP